MKHKHLFPWWAGYLLISPLRKLSLDPDRFLSDYITEGMTVIDAGCAMGFWSLPAARLAGDTGKVLCVDMQERMLKTLKKRADNAGLGGIIKTRLCTAEWLMIDDLYGKSDVAIAFGVIHEAPDEAAFIADLARALKQGGRLIIGEPKSPVPEQLFRETVERACGCGLECESQSEQTSCRIAVFRKS